MYSGFNLNHIIARKIKNIARQGEIVVNLGFNLPWSVRSSNKKGGDRVKGGFEELVILANYNYKKV